MDSIRVAFVGCGRMGGAHMNALKLIAEKQAQDLNIVAFCDIEPEKAADFAARYRAFTGRDAPVFPGVDELLARGPAFEAAFVALPHVEHHRVILKLLNAGKHVLTEKPLGITLRAARLIMDRAAEKGVTLQVAENYRLSPDERAIAWAVQQGMIGQPRVLRMLDVGERQWYWDWRDHRDIAGGGWTVDGGVHFSDLWINILGDVERVTAISKTYSTTRYKKYVIDDQTKQIMAEKMKNYRNTRSLLPANPDTYGEPVEADVEDTTSATVEFKNGVIGTWLVSRAAPGKASREITLHGTDGSITWNEGIMNYRGEVVLSQQELTGQYLDSLTTEEKERVFPLGLTDTLAIEWRYFVEALLQGRPLEVDGWVGYRAMALPMAVYESAALGGLPVRMEDVLNLRVEGYQAAINEAIGL